MRLRLVSGCGIWTRVSRRMRLRVVLVAAYGTSLGCCLLALAVKIFCLLATFAAESTAINATQSDLPVFERNFVPKGAWGDHGQEASPFYLNGKLYQMQSIMGRFPADGSQGSHSGFCVYDARTGETVSCPDSSSLCALTFPLFCVFRSVP